MGMLNMNITIDQLAMANCVCWCCHLLRKTVGHVLGSALWFRLKGQREKWKPRGIWMKQVEEESM